MKLSEFTIPELLAELQRRLGEGQQPPAASLEDKILDAAAQASGCPVHRIKDPSIHNQRTAWARILVMVELRERAGYGHKEIAKIVGLTTHSSSIIAKKRMNELYKSKPGFRAIAKNFLEIIKTIQP